MSKLDLLKGIGNNPNALQILQGYSLAGKIAHSERKIVEWYEYHKGNVYVSFSGGKDSTVLLNLVRSMYPEVPAVFVDTGLEFPEIRAFVKTINNVIWLKPKVPFTKVLEKYGYPIVSKEQSQYIGQYRCAKSEKTKDTRMNGNAWGRGKISEKWKYLLNAPFQISEKCCDIMKKAPIYKYEKETGRKGFIGVMASESAKRVQDYGRFGCNAYKAKRQISRPIAFWTEKDIWEYLSLYKLPYSSIYNMGYNRTGCMFCMYGLHMDKSPTRLELMQKTHPKIYEYCMEKLGLKKVLEWYPIRKEEKMNLIEAIKRGEGK